MQRPGPGLDNGRGSVKVHGCFNVVLIAEQQKQPYCRTGEGRGGGRAKRQRGGESKSNQRTSPKLIGDQHFAYVALPMSRTGGSAQTERNGEASRVVRQNNNLPPTHQTRYEAVGGQLLLVHNNSN
ncbi:hypothetical protein IF1G_03437 [Cordyceps javanica]|uniref:Uncharacterized protein n=1 Tax=Cordyceps javanica TaxID=43265 RepID=A0A545V7K6_9HYPO|nr:hypothetical protein IF1G_03437 [Cordyceps javanica]